MAPETPAHYLEIPSPQRIQSDAQNILYILRKLLKLQIPLPNSDTVFSLFGYLTWAAKAAPTKPETCYRKQDILWRNNYLITKFLDPRSLALNNCLWINMHLKLQGSSTHQNKSQFPCWFQHLNVLVERDYKVALVVGFWDPILLSMSAHMKPPTDAFITPPYPFLIFMIRQLVRINYFVFSLSQEWIPVLLCFLAFPGIPLIP